MKTRIYPISV